MEILVWLLPGVLIGWTAAVLLRRESSAMLANLVLGALGAACGSWLLGPALGVPLQSGSVGAANLQMAVLGAILVLAAANLLAPRRGFTSKRRARNCSAAATTTGEQPVRG